MCTQVSKWKASWRQGAATLLLVFLILAPLGCKTNTAGQESPALPASPQAGRPAPAPGTGTTVPLSPTVPAFSLSGEVRAKDKIDVSAKVGGRIIELKAAVGDKVKKNDLLAALEHDTLDIQVKQAEASVEAAGAALKGVQAQMALLQAGATKEQIDGAEALLRGTEAALALLKAGATQAQIDAAQAGVTAAQARLDQLMAGARPEQVKIADFQVDLAQQSALTTQYRTSLYPPPGLADRSIPYANLGDAERTLASMQVDLAKYQADLLKLAPRQEDVTQLKAAVDAASAQLEALKAAPRSQQVAQLQAAIDAAKAQVEGLKAPPRPQQVAQLQAAIDAARIQVALAQATVLLAKAQREEASVYSPLDGVVSSRKLAVGELASPGATILTIVSRETEVVISLDEVDLNRVSAGQTVSITVPAYRDQVFTGKVRAIAPLGDFSTRTFEVYIDAQDPNSLLRPGMSAAVSLPPAR